MKLYKLIYHLIVTAKVNMYMRILKLKLKHLGDYCRIYYPYFTNPTKVSIGHHVYINRNCDFIATAGNITIGNYVMFGPSVRLIAQDHDISDSSQPMIFSHKYTVGNVVIDDDVWIGAGVTIISGVTVGRGSVIAAGAVVTKSVSPYTIVAGVPAKVIKNRQLSHVDLDKFKNTKINWLTWGSPNV